MNEELYIFLKITHDLSLVMIILWQMTKYGAYSKTKVYYPQDIKDLVTYALVRGVKIIPELDAPAHAGFLNSLLFFDSSSYSNSILITAMSMSQLYRKRLAVGSVREFRRFSCLCKCSTVEKLLWSASLWATEPRK